MAMPFIRHVLKNTFLLCLSVVGFPITTVVVLACHAYTRLSSWLGHHASKCQRSAASKTILVTGVNMAKGLSTARLFHQRGHRVIGADTHRLSPGRASVALSKFYVLPGPSATEVNQSGAHKTPYISSLQGIIETEKVDLWVSVSDVNAAIEDAQARHIIECTTKAKAIQLYESQVDVLHNKALFMDHVQSLGLNAPDTKTVSTENELIDFLRARGGLSLNSAGGTQYVVKPIDVNDVARFDMAILPRHSELDTMKAISTIPFEHGNEIPSFLVQEYIRGVEYCTHALVIRGRIRAFVACPSASVLMHYSALPPSSHLSQKMQRFTESIVENDSADWTGHISFDFIVKSKVSCHLQDDQNAEAYPIECNPRVHTAVVLFNDTPDLVEEYLSALDPYAAQQPGMPMYPKTHQMYYWLGQDLVELAVLPIMRLLFTSSGDVNQVKKSLAMLWRHLWNWKDATFEVWDPWPFWWLYHVYWPAQFAWYMRSTRWQMINVSTGKVFKAAF